MPLLSFIMYQDNVSEELKEAFKVFDRDQDGYICANEVNILFLHDATVCFLSGVV